MAAVSMFWNTNIAAVTSSKPSIYYRFFDKIDETANRYFFFTFDKS